MAASDARPVVLKNTKFRYYFNFRKNDGTIITAPTGVASQRMGDDTTGFNNSTNAVTAVGTAGLQYLDLEAAETNYDCVTVWITCTNTGAVPIMESFYPTNANGAKIPVNLKSVADSDVTATGGRPEVNMSHVGGSAVIQAGGRPEVNMSHVGGSAVIQAGGRPEVNTTHFGGAAGDFVVAGRPSVNLTNWRGVQPNILSSGRVDSILGALASAVITAAGFATDAIDANALKADAVTEIVNAVKAIVVETQGSYTLQQALSLMLAVLAGRTDTNGSVFRTPDGVAVRVTATTDASDNRTGMTLAPSA